jgi:hypothetical protein
MKLGVRSWALGVAACSLVFEIHTLSAQPSQLQTPNSQLKVYLVTIGQGAAYWEKYGHNMLWFHDQAAGVDEAYNWGMFDFAAPDFLQRQLVGDPMYSVQAFPGQLLLDHYRKSDRGITLQELNLTPAQAQRALERSRWNARDENKFYRYDYYGDNCSTRVRDMIDYALGGALKASSQDTVDQTYRGETSRLLNDLRITQFGTNVALGRPADRKLTRWEGMFIPMRLRDALKGMQVRDSTGASKPILLGEQVLYESQRHHETATVPNLWIPYLIIGVLLAIEFLVVGVAGNRAGVAEKVFRFEVAVWAMIVGLLGAVVLGGWLFTEHRFWFNNENLLLFNPLALALAVLAPLSIWRPRFTRSAAIVAIVMALLGAVAVMMKGLPGSQRNVALIALVLPAHFAIAFQLWTRARRTVGS